MKIVKQGNITVELTLDECQALAKLIGNHSGNDYKKHGLISKQSELLYQVYGQLCDIIIRDQTYR
jgi:hypothetical protein